MGRPRSRRAHEQVIDAATRLFAERGVDATAMDAIAQESGVSKATIYKHWKNKDELCLEVMARVHRLDERPDFDSGTTRENLTKALMRRGGGHGSKMQEAMLPHLMAYAARHPTFAKAWRMRVMEPPRAQVNELLRKAIERGELPADLDLEVAAAMLIGPMMYGFFLRSFGSKVPEHLPERVVDAFWQAHAI